MKNLKNVLMVATMLSVAACGAEETRVVQPSPSSNYYCVDKENKRVPEANCGSTTTVNNTGGGSSDAFLWFMIGQSMGGGNNNYHGYGSVVSPNAYSSAYEYRRSNPSAYNTLRNDAVRTTTARQAAMNSTSKSSYSSYSSASSSSVSRGGFGSTASSHGSSSGG